MIVKNRIETKLLVTFLALVLWPGLLTSKVLACSQSHGESANDKEVAVRICKVFKDIPTILQMSVGESILYVDVTRTFFDAMKADKITGTGLIKAWMRRMRQETASHAVTVWVYVDSVKVIEGDTSWTGQDKVKFLF